MRDGHPPDAGAAESSAAGPGAGPAANFAARTLRLDLEFDGACFAGWQRQAGARTVQEEVERALLRLTGAQTAVVGAGRTDAGVHARGMVASVRTTSRLAPAVIERALDALLPDDIGVIGVEDAAPGFHALRDARWKWYRYAILPSRRRRVHERHVAWRVVTPLDLGTLAAALDVVAGRHDFRRFQKTGSPRASTIRTIHATALAVERGLVLLDFSGDGFLYGMVRLLVGTLVDASRRPDAEGARSRMRALLSGSGEPVRVGASAPAHGLTLVRVGYSHDVPPPFVGGGPRADLESDANAT